MYTNTYNDIKNAKSLSWSTQKSITDPIKSVYKVLNHFKHQVDFDEIAQRCSENPSHEMFGKTVTQIRDEWSKRGDVGKQRGRWLDSYIQNKLHKKPFTELELAKQDEIMARKFEHFDNLHSNVLVKSGMRPIQYEMWVCSKYGVRGKLDEIFYVDGKFDGYMIADWKNTEKINTFSRDKMQHCLSHLPSCELYEYYLQVYIYQYILSIEYGLPAKASRIFQISNSGYSIIKPPQDFKYDTGLIREVLQESSNIIL